MYIVLIGSVSKNEENEYSDIDICRIDTNIEISRRSSWPQGPINYVDYSIEDFNKLYSNGSLFVYHILIDGKLLKGDIKLWDDLIENFKLAKNFDDELNLYKNVVTELLDLRIYGGTYLTFYSNLFSLLKNYSIFKLANKNIFEFNKKVALTKVFGEKIYNALSSCYNVFEREYSPEILTINIKSSIYAKDLIEEIRVILEADQ